MSYCHSVSFFTAYKIRTTAISNSPDQQETRMEIEMETIDLIFQKKKKKKKGNDQKISVCGFFQCIILQPVAHAQLLIILFQKPSVFAQCDTCRLTAPKIKCRTRSLHNVLSVQSTQNTRSVNAKNVKLLIRCS